MAVSKRIVCLANSRKTGGRCVAGKELDNHRWVRPVGSRPGHEIQVSEERMPGGGLPELLDIIEIGLLGAAPATHQPENWIVDAKHAWTRAGRLNLTEVIEYLDEPESLWSSATPDPSGRTDRIRSYESATASLYFIQIDDLSIVADGKVRGEFTYRGRTHVFSVTDMDIEAEFRSKPGTHHLGRCLITVSLGEAYGPYCYMFIAAVLRVPDDE